MLTDHRGGIRKAHFRSARAEAAEAAGILEALLDMRVVDAVETGAVIGQASTRPVADRQRVDRPGLTATIG